MQFAVIDSSTEIQEDKVAKIAVTKNRIPTKVPAFPIAENTFGREINIRLGPAPIPSVPENTYTAGMINGTCKKGNTCVKNFNLIDRFVQVHFRFYIGAVGDHNSHGYTE